MTSIPTSVLRLALLASGFAVGAAQATLITLTPQADTWVSFGTGQTTNRGTAVVYDIFQNTTIRNFFAYVRFDLSSIPAGATINSAVLTFTNNGTGGTRADTLNTGRFAAYGLLDVAGNTPQNWGETTLVFAGGAENVGAEYIANSGTSFDTTTRTVSFDGVGEFAPNNAVAGTTVGLNTSPSLVSFLDGRHDAALTLATFIIDTPTADAGRGYALASRENLNTAFVPTLAIDYTVIPEPATYAGFAGVLALGLAAWRRRKA